MKVSVTFWDRYWAKVRVHADATRCWEWAGAKTPKGYGKIGAGGKRGPFAYAHRAAWTSWHGRWPTLHVAHGCGNPGCCNPFHLREATPEQNMRDCLRHGTRVRGSRHGLTKLTDADVRAIRRLVAGGFASQSACARTFRVSTGTIHLIVHRRTWCHV